EMKVDRRSVVLHSDAPISWHSETRSAEQGAERICTNAQNQIAFRSCVILRRAVIRFAPRLPGRCQGVVERGPSGGPRANPVNLLLTIHKQPQIVALRAG